jgi:hypothetical protein
VGSGVLYSSGFGEERPGCEQGLYHPTLAQAIAEPRKSLKSS